MVNVQKREHVSADIENKHALAALEHGKRQFLLYIVAQREAVVSVILNVHFVNVFRVSNDRLLPDHAEQGAPEGAIPFAAEQLLEVDKDDNVDK